MSSPLISVVMPTHNYGHFIGEAISSILDQTEMRFELIIVDDSSTDHTQEVLDQYKDNRIVRIQRNECACSNVIARNDGLAIAKGTFIAVADADDISLPNRFERQIAFLSEHPHIHILGGNVYPIDTNGNPIDNIQNASVYEMPETYREALLTNKNVFWHATWMFRSNILNKVPQYNDYPAFGEFEYLLRATRYFNYHNLEEPLIKHRQHPHSTTQIYGPKYKTHHLALFIAREHMWVQNEIKRLKQTSKFL